MQVGLEPETGLEMEPALVPELVPVLVPALELELVLVLVLVQEPVRHKLQQRGLQLPAMLLILILSIFSLSSTSYY